jgi:hypothetical protein
LGLTKVKMFNPVLFSIKYDTDNTKNFSYFSEPPKKIVYNRTFSKVQVNTFRSDLKLTATEFIPMKK